MAEDNSQNDDLELVRPEVVDNLIKRFYDKGNQKRNIRRSRDWFRVQATKLGKIRMGRIMKANNGYKLVDKPQLGKLYLFQYNAKMKDELPYWDAFPLVFFFNSYSNKGNKYLLGLNMHYLPPKLRLVLFERLLTLRTEKRFRKQTRLRMEWDMLKAMSESPLAEAAVHQYIFSSKHIMGKFLEVPAQDWEIVMFLQLARWQNKSQAAVYSDIRRKSRKKKR